jgi:putative membrane protein
MLILAYFFHRMPFLGGGLMLFFGLAILALLIVGLVALFRRRPESHSQGNDHAGQSADADSALRILNERYARGEISDEEYKTKKAEIRK